MNGHAWYAFRVMLLQARRDPLWALVSIVFYPLRAGAYALKIFFVWGIFTLILLGAVEFAVELANLRKSAIHAALNIGAVLIGLAYLGRMAVEPMIIAFGEGYNEVDDSHGSARFASNSERKHLTASSKGLLIGRDPDTGALLRYAGPAHLLTMRAWR